MGVSSVAIKGAKTVGKYSLKGFEQVKKFSWEKAARECLAVYKKACIVK